MCTRLVRLPSAALWVSEVISAHSGAHAQLWVVCLLLPMAGQVRLVFVLRYVVCATVADHIVQSHLTLFLPQRQRWNPLTGV